MLKIEELKIENRCKRLTPESKEQFNALEKLIVNDGEIHDPIIVWKGHKVVADGHCRAEIAKKHPELKYSIKEVEFGDWRDVVAFIVEHHIARNSFSLWQKLEMAMNCIEYWEAKERAQENKGKRSDLMSPSDKKSESIDMNTIIAEKVGCGRTTVTHFMKVFNSPNEGIKQQCREGSLSIKKAYEKLTKKSKPKKNPKPVIEIDTSDILQNIEKNQCLDKTSSVKIPDPAPVATKMTSAKTSAGSVWFVIRPIDHVIQVFSKSIDQEKGQVHIQVNNYTCKPVSQENGVTIVEACHIDGSAEDISQKDDVDFEESKKVS